MSHSYLNIFKDKIFKGFKDLIGGFLISYLYDFLSIKETLKILVNNKWCGKISIIFLKRHMHILCHETKQETVYISNSELLI